MDDGRDDFQHLRDDDGQLSRDGHERAGRDANQVFWRSIFSRADGDGDSPQPSRHGPFLRKRHDSARGDGRRFLLVVGASGFFVERGGAKNSVRKNEPIGPISSDRDQRQRLFGNGDGQRNGQPAAAKRRGDGRKNRLPAAQSAARGLEFDGGRELELGGAERFFIHFAEPDGERGGHFFGDGDDSGDRLRGDGHGARRSKQRAFFDHGLGRDDHVPRFVGAARRDFFETGFDVFVGRAERIFEHGGATVCFFDGHLFGHGDRRGERLHGDRAGDRGFEQNGADGCGRLGFDDLRGPFGDGDGDFERRGGGVSMDWAGRF